jgi:hypothetical protein
MVRIEAGIDAAQRHEGTNQQRRADQQHQRQRHLAHYQERARTVLPQACARAAAAFLQRGAQVRARNSECRYEAEQNAGRQ